MVVSYFVNGAALNTKWGKGKKECEKIERNNSEISKFAPILDLTPINAGKKLEGDAVADGND